MATRKSTSKAGARRSRAASRAAGELSHSSLQEEEIAQSPIESLEDVIEDERMRLMKAHSILSCATLAMEEGDGETPGPYYPAIISVAGDLINETIRRLDSVKLKPFLGPLREVRRR